MMSVSACVQPVASADSPARSLKSPVYSRLPAPSSVSMKDCADPAMCPAG